MTLEQTVTIEGNFKNAYKQAVPGTLKHVDELMREQRTNPELGSLWSYTPDGDVYSMDGKTPTLRITRELTNPVLNHIDDAFDQLTTTGNYKVLPADFRAVKSAADTVTIDLTKLGLQRANEEEGYLAVDTSTAITEYNAEQQKLLRRVFGPTDEDYTANMKMLRESPRQIKKTRVYVLNLQYVEKYAKESPIARASWLYVFDYCSNFNADLCDINDNNRLRGVRREEVAEASQQESHERSDLSDASKNQSPYRTAAETGFKVHYNAILADPESAVKAMDDEVLAGILGLASRYASTKIR